MVRPGKFNHAPSHHIDGVGSCLVLILQLLFIVFCLYMVFVDLSVCMYLVGLAYDRGATNC